MKDVIIDALLDTLKLLPYLLIAFLLLEYIEHKLSSKNEKILISNKKYGVVAGGLLGAIPQCGFSTIAANLFSNRVITIGTLIAIFLSTSDEMLPIMLSQKVSVLLVLKIISFKVIIGIIAGFIIDAILKRKEEKVKNNIHDMCDHEHCHCKEEGILLSSIKHALKVSIFILIANLFIGIIIYYVGEDKISNLLLSKNILTYFIASLIGLIPNCASSVIITELYLSKIITIGNLLSGLLTGSGLGILLLFKTNKNLKENLTIISIVYFIGVITGIIVDLVI